MKPLAFFNGVCHGKNEGICWRMLLVLMRETPKTCFGSPETFEYVICRFVVSDGAI